MRIQSLWLALAAAASMSAAALEVGPLQLRRPAGQPAYAEIVLSGSTPIDPAAVRARIATPEGYRVAGMRYVPALRSLSMTPQPAPNGTVVLRIDGFPSSSEVGELDLLLLVGDRVSLSLNEYRIDLRSAAREFQPSPPGTRLASRPPPATALASEAPSAPSRPPAPERAAAAQQAEQPAPAAAATGLDAATSSQVAQALAAWVKAWSDRNVDGYLSAYVANYQPPNRRMSHADWEKQRRSRIAAKQLIEVALSDVQFGRRGDSVVAMFQQRYRGDSIVESSRKRVVFVREEDRWLIQEEAELR